MVIGILGLDLTLFILQKKKCCSHKYVNPKRGNHFQGVLMNCWKRVTFLKESGGISFHPDESVSLYIVHVGPYSAALVCIPPLVDYLFFFRVHVILWFLYFDLFQVKVQLVSKRVMDYIVICFWIVDFNVGTQWDLVLMFCRLFS